MKTLSIDFSKVNGKIKPMNATNNGPCGGGVRGETPFIKNFRQANIPYARLHDSAYYQPYGGEWAVDVHRIFRNFDADENNPENYVFGPTDNYIKAIKQSGCDIFYRLGASIEHYYHYGTYPPKDYLKWAKICEKIILHYNEGWANGYNYGIKYWEIWNEPDCINADGSNPCWQGTKEEFAEFYDVVSKYLKSKFPNLKIGGPAICTVWSEDLPDYFLKKVKENGSVMDFFSYHCYGPTVENFVETIDKANQLLEKHGLLGVEKILDEWQYIRGWSGAIYRESLQDAGRIIGASYITGAMCAGQAVDVDMLMYYDVRPTGAFNGLGAQLDKPKKPYYALKAFGHLLELGDCVQTKYVDENIYNAVATNGKEHAILLTYFNNDIKTGKEKVKLEFNNALLGDKVKVEYYLLDENNDLEIVREEIFTSNEFASYIKVDLYTVYLIKIIPQ